MVPQFEEALFRLKKGEITPAPVRTPFGYHAIKVLDVQESGKSPYKDVADKIKEKLLAERSDRAAAAKAEQVRGPLQAAKDFASEAKSLGVEARTATVARGDGLEGIGRDPALEEAVFGLGVGGVTSPIKTAGGYVVAKVIEIMPAGVPPLAEVRNEVSEAIKRDKAGDLAMAKAKTVAVAAREGDFAAAAKKEGAASGDTGFFSRAEPPKDKSAVPGTALVAALQTSAGQVAEPIRANGAVYVVKVLERQPADPKGLETEREELAKQVLEQKRNQVWESWLRGINQGAKIELSSLSAPAGR